MLSYPRVRRISGKITWCSYGRAQTNPRKKHNELNCRGWWLKNRLQESQPVKCYQLNIVGEEKIKQSECGPKDIANYSFSYQLETTVDKKRISAEKVLGPSTCKIWNFQRKLRSNISVFFSGSFFHVIEDLNPFVRLLIHFIRKYHLPSTWLTPIRATCVNFFCNGVNCP